MKKFLALFLVLTVVIGLCACGKKPTGTTAATTPDGRIILTIGLPVNAKVMDHNEQALTKWIEEKCNVEIQFMEYPGGTDVATQISTTIAAGGEGLPDIVFGCNLTSAAIEQYGRDGFFLNLKEYFDDRDGASKIYWDRLEKNLDENGIKLVEDWITDRGNDDAIYGVPSIEVSPFDFQYYQVYINQTWLDKLSLDAPTDPDSLYNVLKAFQQNDCNGNGTNKDEIPLVGSISSQAGLGAQVIDWLINLYIYYDRTRAYNVDENGKLFPVYTSDEYRNALKFINKLYKEGLITDSAWIATGSEMQQYTTPNEGQPISGVVCMHPSVQTIEGNEGLYQYVPLKPFGYIINDDVKCTLNAHITDQCAAPEKAFEVLMTLFSWDGSMRQRYGEYGVSWTDPDPGAKSPVGMDAEYKLLSDPLTNRVGLWSKMGACFNMYAEGETAQVADEMSDWDKYRIKIMGEHLAMTQAQAAAKNPTKIVPQLHYTEEEREQVDMKRTNINERYKAAQTEFCTGVMDPNDDAQWNAYVAQLESFGLAEVMQVTQAAYDRG